MTSLEKSSLSHHALYLCPTKEIITEIFSDEQLMSVSPSTVLWYADILNYLVTEQMPDLWTKEE